MLDWLSASMREQQTERSVCWGTKLKVLLIHAVSHLAGICIAELERDLELERRKMHELQDASREREKEYLKLKVKTFHFLSAMQSLDWAGST